MSAVDIADSLVGDADALGDDLVFSETGELVGGTAQPSQSAPPAPQSLPPQQAAPTPEPQPDPKAEARSSQRAMKKTTSTGPTQQTLPITGLSAPRIDAYLQAQSDDQASSSLPVYPTLPKS